MSHTRTYKKRHQSSWQHMGVTHTHTVSNTELFSTIYGNILMHISRLLHSYTSLHLSNNNSTDTDILYKVTYGTRGIWTCNQLQIKFVWPVLQAMSQRASHMSIELPFSQPEPSWKTRKTLSKSHWEKMSEPWEEEFGEGSEDSWWQRGADHRLNIVIHQEEGSKRRE